jgi:hypothetical protein
VADDTRNEVDGKMADVVYLADARVRKHLRTVGHIVECLDRCEIDQDGGGVVFFTIWLKYELLRLDEARLEAAKQPAPVTVPAGGTRP